MRLSAEQLRDVAADAEQVAAQTIAQADRLIAQGQPLRAYDLTKRLLAERPNDERIALRNAHALRRCGALGLALRNLDRLTGPDVDGERRGLIAAVHKEMFVRARNRPGSDSLEHLRRAQRLYQDVFDESGGTKYWHGINAATLAILTGDEDLARALAARVWAACPAPAHSDDPYWLLATRAEAALVQGRLDVAADEYRKAVRVAGDRISDIAATRQNAMLLLQARGLAEAERRAIAAALEPPAVVVFAGLPLDAPDATTPRFPPELAADVRAAIDERLAALRVGFGFSGATPGSELLFVEAMLDRNPGVANVVLPWPRAQFVATHVNAAGEEWRRRFDDLMGTDGHEPRVQHQVHATLGIGLDGPLYEQFAKQLLFGLARLHARTLATDVVPLVVSDGRRDGGIAELMELWESQGVRVAPDNLIDLEPMTARRPSRPAGAPSTPARTPAPAPAQVAFRVMAILFADVEDYSKIPEDRLPSFIEHFVGGVAARLRDKPYRAANIRRVGDGLLMVFASVRDAAACALDLVDWVADGSRTGTDGVTHWSRVGLLREMRLRVALHAGPIFECEDPLTHTVAFEGAHVNYAARIEPVTPGNQVYASEAFAALAASWPEPCHEFVCEYVGRTPLAKNFGDYPLYHLRRS